MSFINAMYQNSQQMGYYSPYKSSGYSSFTSNQPQISHQQAFFANFINLINNTINPESKDSSPFWNNVLNSKPNEHTVGGLKPLPLIGGPGATLSEYVAGIQELGTDEVSNGTWSEAALCETVGRSFTQDGVQKYSEQAELYTVHLIS